jgi:hypothetical protein
LCIARGFEIAVPADLLDAIVELVDVAVGIGRIEMPVRPRQVAPRAQHAPLAPHEPLVAFGDFAQAADLPGDLIDRELGIAAIVRIDLRERPAGEQHE